MGTAPHPPEVADTITDDYYKWRGLFQMSEANGDTTGSAHGAVSVALQINGVK
jgi:hypothetical protein